MTSLSHSVDAEKQRMTWVETISALAVCGLAVRAALYQLDTAPVLALTVCALLPIFALLTVTDVRSHRLPNKLTATSAGVVAVGVVTASLTGGGASVMTRALAGAVALGVFYLSLALLGRGNGMGLGDVKLAPSVGALTMWGGPDAFIGAFIASFLAGGVCALVLMLRGHGRHAHLPFGPFMIGGTVLALG